MKTLTRKSLIYGSLSFEQNIKEYLKERDNITIDEEIIWTIKQIYKKENKITGKKKYKNEIISSFRNFIHNRENEDLKIHESTTTKRKGKKNSGAPQTLSDAGRNNASKQRRDIEGKYLAQEMETMKKGNRRRVTSKQDNNTPNFNEISDDDTMDIDEIVNTYM